MEGEKGAYIFFPESFRFYAVSTEDAASLRQYLDGVGPVRKELEAILKNEEEKGIAETASVDAETDSLCLYMAHDCNISCTYCYNEGGRSVNPAMMMSPDIVEAAFRRFFTMAGKDYAASFYGGEPLLNFKTIKKAVEIGDSLERERGITISYSMTTNGTILSDEMEEFIKGRVSSVCISIDGERDTHDLHRKAASGSAYEKAVQTLKRLHGGKCRVTLRATVAGDTVSLLRDTVSRLSSLPSDGFSVSPVNTGSSNPAYITDEGFDEYVKRFTDLTRRRFREVIDGTGQGFKYTFNIVLNLLTKRRFIKHCDAGQNPAIAADGSMYACHGLVGDPGFYMGNVGDEPGHAFGKLKGTFDGLTVHGIKECKECWARYLCGGSCYAHAYINTGDLYRAEPRHCKLFKRNAEVVITEFLSAMNDPAKREGLYKNLKKAVAGRRGNGCGE
jgi:uncharacterized protein